MRRLGAILVLVGVMVILGTALYSSATDSYTVEAQENFRKVREDLTTSTLIRETTTTLTTVEDDPTFDFGDGYEQEVVTTTPASPEPGTPLGKLWFSTLDEEWIVVEGVGVEDLKLGPGHMPWTPMPGTEGNAVISGHRTTYGAPFYDLHLLEVGDLIEFEGVKYGVNEILIVRPDEVWVTEPRGEGMHLTLTTCNPIGSARERLIVFASVPKIGQ